MVAARDQQKEGIVVKEDTLEIEILPDGTIKVSTDQISPANHLSADNFLKFLAEMAGGEVTKARNRRAHTHHHEHQHVNQGE